MMVAGLSELPPDVPTDPKALLAWTGEAILAGMAS